MSPGEAIETQRHLSKEVFRTGDVTAPKLIAGVDIANGGEQGIAQAAVVVLNYPALHTVEIAIARDRLDFPYVPVLLSFRESPLILAACRKLAHTPDLIMADGHGIAHPRRLGIACHLGLFLDIPAVGCAKSHLCGSHAEPAGEPGSYAEVTDRGDTIGAALRTKRGSKPCYVSTGHKINLESAIYWVLHCCRGYRLPEPTRLAHLTAGGNANLEEVATSR